MFLVTFSGRSARKRTNENILILFQQVSIKITVVLFVVSLIIHFLQNMKQSGPSPQGQSLI